MIHYLAQSECPPMLTDDLSTAIFHNWELNYSINVAVSERHF